MCDCPCHTQQVEECFCTPACIRGEPEPTAREILIPDALPIPDDWWFAIEYHRLICVLLRKLGIPAYEEGTGGGNFHVAFPRGERFILADANDGYWRAGIYVSLDDAFECQYESWLVESDILDEDSPAEDVVAWLLSLPISSIKE